MRRDRGTAGSSSSGGGSAGDAMRMMGPAQQAMIDRAVGHARAAGVPEDTIQRVIQQEAAARGGGLVPAVLAGRLNALASQFQREQRPPGG